MLLASRRARAASSRSLLHGVHDLLQPGRQAGHREALLLPAGAPGQHDGIARHVPRPDLEPQRDAPALPLVVLGPGFYPFARVEMGPDAGGQQLTLDPVGDGQHGGPILVGFPDRHQHHLVLRQARRADQARVVAVRHDERADQPGGDPPGGVPHVVHPTGGRLERDLERLGEVLSQVVAGARLERLVVLHQRFAAVGPKGAGEALAVGLPAGHHRHRHPLLHEPAVDPEHRAGSPPPPRPPSHERCDPPARETP